MTSTRRFIFSHGGSDYHIMVKIITRLFGLSYGGRHNCFTVNPSRVSVQLNNLMGYSEGLAFGLGLGFGLVRPMVSVTVKIRVSKMLGLG